MTIDSAIIEQIVETTVDSVSVVNNYSFCAPKESLIGENASVKLGPLLAEEGVETALFIVDKIVHQLGLVDTALRSCRRAGVATEIFTGIDGETDFAQLTAGVAKAVDCGADYIVGFGGGSAIDAAKAIAVLATKPAGIDDTSYLSQPKINRLGLAAVPTTAGTGSEVTDVAVILNRQTQHKLVVKNKKLIPDLALIDPCLMLKIPPSVTAMTGIDALCHALEAYVAKDSCSLARALSARAVRLCFRWLPQCVGRGDDVNARLKMSEASHMAGLAFSNAGLGLVHAMSHQVGAKYHIPHGVANAIILPSVMRFNALVSSRGYATLARSTDLPVEGLSSKQQAEQLIDAVAELVASVGIEADFSGYQMKQEDFPGLADQALNDICITANPRTADRRAIIAIYQQLQG